MSSEHKTTLRRIRTFASDMAEAQGKNGQPLDSVSGPTGQAPLPVPAEKAAAAKVFATVTPTVERVPSFHELQKKTLLPIIPLTVAHSTPSLPFIKKEETNKIVVRAKKPDLTKKVSVSGGMVITDTKKAEQNFLGAFFASITGWLSSVSKSFQKKQPTTYKVADAEHRKGVIQKATSKTGSIFTADNETLKEEIRRRQQTPVPHHTEVTWSPQVESGYALLESDAVKIPQPIAKPERIKVEFKKTSIPEPIIVEPSFVEPSPVLPPLTGYWESEAPTRKETVAQPQSLVTPLSPAEITTAPEPILQTTADDSQIEAEEASAVRIHVAIPPRPRRRGRITLREFITIVRTNTNALTLTIASVVAVVVLIVVIVKVLVGTLLTQNIATEVSAPATPFLTTTAMVDVSIPSNSIESLIGVLQENSSLSGKPTEARVLNAAGTPLNSSVLLPILGFSGNRNLNQAVTEAHLVTVANSRSIVLKVTDSTTVLGALLSWEPTMAQSLATTLAIPNPSSVATFVDSTIGTTDIRVLTSDGVEIVTYGFINQDTVLITKDTTTFKVILGSQ